MKKKNLKIFFFKRKNTSLKFLVKTSTVFIRNIIEKKREKKENIKFDLII